MMTSSVYCQSKDYDCPYYKYCIARLADPTIIGCGMYLYCQGYISAEEIGVLHKVEKEAYKDDVKIW